MHYAQRILLAVSCLSCLALLKHLWDSASSPAYPAQGRVHIGSDGFMSYVNPDGADVEHGQKAAVHNSSDDSPCQGLEGIDDLAIVLKTGSTEIYEKLPIHLATTFQCVEDRLVYSDVQQDFAGEPVRDALALVSKEARSKRKELHQYGILNDYVREGGTAAELRGDESWHLDKWKFLPMISDAYFTFGDRKKWYLFIEADTYVSLHNLMPWLARLDSQETIYAGAQVMIGRTEFGHGGSGFLLSNTAAKALSTTYRKDQPLWEGKVSDDCCGDKVMAEVLKAANPSVRLLRSFPLIQGETLSSLDWSRNHWCKPAVTWHHVDAAGIDKLWQFENRWRAEKAATIPILFRDYYATFIHPRLLASNGTMADWGNLSDEWTFSTEQDSSAHAETRRTCEAFCDQTPSCVQWAWRPGSCKAGSKVRFGWALRNRPALGSAEDRIEKVDGKALEGAVSGWMMDRIQKYRDDMSQCDDGSIWITKNND